jgi:hypothetical protein
MKGERRGAAESAAAAADRRGRGEEERKGGEGRLTGGAQASARAGKKKKKEGTRAGAGRGWWAAGLFGPKGEKVRFLFFFFSFSNFFLKPLFFSNSNQNSFNLFLKNL